MFEVILFELVLRGNELAIQLQRDLIGLSLKQLFSDAFGIHFDKEDRANWLENRQLARKSFRPCYTDLLKEYQEKHQVDLYYGVEVNRLKAAIKLPIKPIEEYDEDQIRRWKDGLVTMKTLLKIMPPNEAYKVIDIY